VSEDRRKQSQAVYEWLRSANPHLPPADRVSAELPVELAFGPDHVTTVTLTVVVALPDAPMPGGEPQ
jgi:hypothetical protein